MSVNGHPLQYYHEKCNYTFAWYSWSQTLRKYWSSNRLPIFKQLAVECNMEYKELLRYDHKDINRNREMITNVQENAHRIDLYFLSHPDCVGFNKSWNKFLKHICKKQKEANNRNEEWKLPNISNTIA